MGADRQERGPDSAAVDEILAHAARLGLPISAEDAARLVPGRRRMQAMAREVRALAGPDVEPAGPAVAPWRVSPHDRRGDERGDGDGDGHGDGRS